jgi:hypothetical protein
MVCLCWCSCHMWSHTALFHLGDCSNQIRSSITTAVDYRSIYSSALVFRAQGVSFLASGVAPHLHIGWSRLESIRQCDGACNTYRFAQQNGQKDEHAHAIQLDPGYSHPIELSSSPVLGITTPTRPNCN